MNAWLKPSVSVKRKETENESANDNQIKKKKANLVSKELIRKWQGQYKWLNVQYKDNVPYVSCTNYKETGKKNFFTVTDASGYFMRKFLGSSKCRPDEEEPWSYREKNGPKKWGQRYPTCNGREQSPIDIKSYNAIFDSNLPRLTMKSYNVPVTRATIENNGHTIEITPTDGVQRSILVNNDIYNLAQLHFHWGDTPDRGAEHTLNGVQYSMELHFVHMNAQREVAVVGVFFQDHNRKNGELQNVISNFPRVMYRDARSELNTPLNLNHLLPSNPSSFFRYRGSLTTPNCTEGVTWSVLPFPLPVSKDQIKEFRKLYSVRKSDASKNCKLTDNYRPVQPLNKRTVYLSQ